VETFKRRLARIGIDIEYVGNYPWVYLHRVNGIYVKEKFMSEYGFTIFFKRADGAVNFNSEAFKIIRRYL
jgi:hypothetical protein